MENNKMNFKNWLKIVESGTFSSAPTGGVGDIAPFKAPVGMGMIKRTYPFLDQNQPKKKKKRA